MDDLAFPVDIAVPWFEHAQETPYVLVRVSEADAEAWSATLGVAIRRCYITDAVLDDRAAALGRPKSEILAARLPDAGSIMAGDFGEILVYFYQSAKEHPGSAFGPKKWRLKQDRTKAAPYSDVIHFFLPHWPTASAEDVILCSEVKTKSTPGASTPIASAIADCEKDRISRLARTLVWLKERALLEDLGDVQIPHLNRFINTTDYPAATKRFRAVAVVCATLVDDELPRAPTTPSPHYTMVIISVPKLKETYTNVFDAVRRTLETAVEHIEEPK